ncbi:MAG: hypothetical protein Q8L81_08130 [Bacteroidota bacterium]|nr:hypothetical protein [Bacteroidota bacterium]
MNAKEKWIQDTENSLNGLKPAEVNPYLYSKILNRLSAKVEVAPSKLVWAAAASFLALILLNVFVFRTSASKNNSELQILAQHYHLLNDNTINYN